MASVARSVRWDALDWHRIQVLAKQMSEEQLHDVTAVDVIKSAVRRFLDERLGAAGSEK